jgi:hypothetical protein
MAGSHAITAVYSGDANNAASTSNTLTQQVDQATTSTILGSTTNPSTVGQSVAFFATVAGQSLTGTVTFKDGATTICAAVALSSGSASCATSTLSGGTHAITAAYSGDANNAMSISNTVTQQVTTGSGSTTTTLATNCMTTFVEDQPFTMTASVAGAALTGTLSFATQTNIVLCGNVSLVSGSASCTTNALTAVGPADQVYSLKATYSGDANNASSTSGALTLTVLDTSGVVFRNSFEVDSLSCPIE